MRAFAIVPQKITHFFYLESDNNDTCRHTHRTCVHQTARLIGLVRRIFKDEKVEAGRVQYLL